MKSFEERHRTPSLVAQDDGSLTRLSPTPVSAFRHSFRLVCRVLWSLRYHYFLTKPLPIFQLLNDYERGPIIKAASRTSSTGSSAITSPDYLEHNIIDGNDLPSTLEPVARFLEHAQQIEMNYKNNMVVEKVSKERTRRVLEQLAHLKESVSTSALDCLKKTFEFNEELQGIDGVKFVAIL